MEQIFYFLKRHRRAIFRFLRKAFQKFKKHQAAGAGAGAGAAASSPYRSAYRSSASLDMVVTRNGNAQKS